MRLARDVARPGRVHPPRGGAFQIDLDGDRGDIRAMFHCTLRLPGAGGVTVAGRYQREEHMRTADGWRIRRLRDDNRWFDGVVPG